MIKVALEVSSLASKQAIRGVGFYTGRLTEAFNSLKRDDFKIEQINFHQMKAASLTKYSLAHFPYFDPFFLTLPLHKSLPTVVTVHDLIPLKFARHFPKGIKGWLKWQMQKYSLRGVDAIITDSQSSRKDIVEIVGFPERKIFRIYLAADKKFRLLKKNKSGKIFKKYSLPDKFILYVGDLNWNKNIPFLVKAFSRLSPKKSNLYLLIVGKAFLEKKLTERKELIQLIKEVNLAGQIRFLGFVPTEDLVVLYNLALCYCQPSFYEGFGLPVLEAMACGCPVVCSNKSSLPEIAGKGACLVDPYKVEEIARGIDKVLRNKRLQNELKKEGLKQAKKFSWEKTARETLEVYQDVIKPSSWRRSPPG